MEPEWSDFRVLLALASAGSVAGAARELHVDNSTVSRRLAALEEAVGAKLIIRGGREFNGTAEGRTLLSAAKAMDSAVTQAMLSMRTAKAEVEGTVRVSISFSNATRRCFPGAEGRGPWTARSASRRSPGSGHSTIAEDADASALSITISARWPTPRRHVAGGAPNSRLNARLKAASES